MRQIDEFRIFYNHTIHPELMRMERLRRRLWGLLVFSFFLLVGIIVMEFFLHIPLLSLLLLIGVFFYITFLFYRIQRFRITFKPNVVNLILDFIDNGPNYGTLKYDPQGFISRQRFLASGIFATNAPEYSGEDMISGKIGELDFALCELNVREFSLVRNRLNYIFRGVFLWATFRHTMQGEIIVLPKEFKQYLSRSIKAINRRGGEMIEGEEMEPNFDEFFMTYATRGMYWSKVLTRELQQAILDYRLRTGKHLYVSFINQEIYIAITEPKDILEPFIFRSNVSFELVREFFDDIHLLLRIVEDFDNNN